MTNYIFNKSNVNVTISRWTKQPRFWSYESL